MTKLTTSKILRNDTNNQISCLAQTIAKVNGSGSSSAKKSKRHDLIIVIDILQERSGFQHKGDFQGRIQRAD